MNFRHPLLYSNIIIVLSLAKHAVIAGPSKSPGSKGVDHPFSFSYGAWRDLTAKLIDDPFLVSEGTDSTVSQAPIAFPITLSLQQCLSWPLAVGIRLASTLDPKEESLAPSSFRKLGLCLATACRTSSWDSSGLFLAGQRTAILELWSIPETSCRLNFVCFAYKTYPQFSGRRASLREYCLAAGYCETPLTSTFAAPCEGYFSLFLLKYFIG